jgi:hypothetical protein
MMSVRPSGWADRFLPWLGSGFLGWKKPGQRAISIENYSQFD